MTQEMWQLIVINNASSINLGIIRKQAESKPETENTTQLQVWEHHKNWGMWDNNLIYCANDKSQRQLKLQIYLESKYYMRANGWARVYSPLIQDMTRKQWISSVRSVLC